MAHAPETSVHASHLGPVRLPIHFFAVATEIDRGANDDSFPSKAASPGRRYPPRDGSQRHRAGRHWRAENVDGATGPDLRREYVPDLNGLSAMGFALPGAIAAKLAHPGRKVLAVTGDGGFLMNSQELETAVRGERIRSSCSCGRTAPTDLSNGRWTSSSGATPIATSRIPILWHTPKPGHEGIPRQRRR